MTTAVRGRNWGLRMSVPGRSVSVRAGCDVPADGNHWKPTLNDERFGWELVPRDTGTPLRIFKNQLLTFYLIVGSCHWGFKNWQWTCQNHLLYSASDTLIKGNCSHGWNPLDKKRDTSLWQSCSMWRPRSWGSSPPLPLTGYGGHFI